ncbi:Inactive peptidyl-prolyl cis-trans isomerase fkbp6 [Chamberlinius hualienensis]
MADNSDDHFSSGEDEEKMTVPLRTGLDIKELFKSKTATIDIDTERLKRECPDLGSNVYIYDESTIDILDCDCLGGEDSNDEEGDSLAPFDKIERQMEKLTDDGGVMKKIASEGDGSPLPNGATVVINYDAYIEYQMEPFDSTRLRKKPQSVCLGNGDVITGLDIAVQSMTQNEVAHFLIKPEYAYGKMGCPPRIPGNAAVYYKVHLLDYIDYVAATKFNKLTDEEKEKAGFKMCLEAVDSELSYGNKLCKKHGDHRKAAHHYKKAVQMLEHCTLKNEEEDALWKNRMIRLNRNISLCCLKLEAYPKVITFANQALEFDSKDVKSLYYKGKAKYMLNDFDEARRWLMKAKHIQPTDSSINQALTELKLRQDKSKASDKLFCQRMFQKTPHSLALKNVKPEVEEIISCFVNDVECTQTSFSFGGNESDITWLAEKVSNLNLHLDTITGITHFHSIMNKRVEEERCDKKEDSSPASRICSLPPIRLQSGEYYQPVKIVNYRTVITDEVVGVINVDLIFIPTVYVKWTTYPPNQYNSRCVYAYFLTTVNVNGCKAQYLMHPSLNEKYRLHCGDMIRITQISLNPLKDNLTRAFAGLDDFKLLNPEEETKTTSQGLAITNTRLDWWTLKREDTKKVIEVVESLGYPSPFFNRLYYWFEQCAYIPPIQLDINRDIPETSVAEILDKFCIAKALDFLNISQRVSHSLIAVVIAVRKPINYLVVAENPVLPIRTVLTVADDSGCCDIILWNEMAAAAQANIQLGTLVLVEHFSFKSCKPDPYAIRHPSVSRIPVELSIEQGVNICSSGTLTRLPLCYLDQFSFPTAFYNFASISEAPQWNHNDSVSVIGVVVGISRYHVRSSYEKHIGRNYVRRWIDLCDVKTGASISVCLYVNRCLERHLSIKLNTILSLTNMLVKCENCLGKLKFSSLHSAAATEIFVIPGPGDDCLPSFIQKQVEEIKKNIQTNDSRMLTWLGGIHPFENYLLEEEYYEHLLEESWGLKELQNATKLSIMNHQQDFVFPSRIARVESCLLPNAVSWSAQHETSALCRLIVESHVIWERETWKENKKHLQDLYGSDKPCFDRLTLSVSPFDDASKLITQHLQFPSTNVLDELDLKEHNFLENTFEADVINRPLFKITFEHLKDNVAICVLFSPEESSSRENFKDLLKLNFEPKRSSWNSPILTQTNTMCDFNMDLSEDEEFMPWIRIQCIGRNNFEFQLCYLGI